MINGYFQTDFFMNHTFCVFVRIASARRFLQIPKMYVFLKNNMGMSMKKIHDSMSFVQTELTYMYNEFCCYNECRYKEGSLYTSSE